MLLQSVRDLKIQLAQEVFGPLAQDLLERALKPKLGMAPRPSPLQRLALGIGRGRLPGDFSLAVRLQTNSPDLQRIVAHLSQETHGEIDVLFVGRPRAFAGDPPPPEVLRKACRPLVVGCSVGHIAATAGTLGLLARHRKTGHPVMLSNAHILAPSGKAKSGEPVMQPGPIDGGGLPSTRVGALFDVIPLKADGPNQADAAIAMIDPSVTIFDGGVPGLGAFVIGPDEAIRPGVGVVKLGRTTGIRHGQIRATELDDLGVDYDSGTLVFDNQIEIEGEPGLPFSDNGDSGSLVLDEGLRAIGLVFAGVPEGNEGRGLSYANHLPRILTFLDLVSL